MISASDQSERAISRIFGVESDVVLLEGLAYADDDRHRTLDAKLTETLANIMKSEPARKMTLAFERAALFYFMFSDRPCLLII